MKRRSLSTPVKLIISSVGLACAFMLVDSQELNAMLGQASPGWLVVGVMTSLVGSVFGTLSWNAAVSVRAPGVPFRHVFTSYWTGLFFNIFLPSTIGGDVAKGLSITADRKHPLLFVATIMIDRIVNLSVLMLIGLSVMFWMIGQYAIMLAGLLVTASVCILFLARGRQMSAILCGKVRHFPYAKRRAARGGIRMFIYCVQILTRSPASTLKMIVFAGGSQFCKIWLHAFIILGLSLDIDPRMLFIIIPLFGIVSAIPISIGGIGTRELFGIWLASRLGLDMTAVACLGLIGHATVATAGAFGGLVFLMGRRRHA